MNIYQNWVHWIFWLLDSRSNLLESFYRFLCVVTQSKNIDVWIMADCSEPEVLSSCSRYCQYYLFLSNQDHKGFLLSTFLLLICWERSLDWYQDLSTWLFSMFSFGQQCLDLSFLSGLLKISLLHHCCKHSSKEMPDLQLLLFPTWQQEDVWPHHNGLFHDCCHHYHPNSFDHNQQPHK